MEDVSQPRKPRVEATACPLCRSDDYKVLFEAIDRLHGLGARHRYVRCADCALVFMNPRVVDADLTLLYPAETYAAYQSSRPPPPRRGLAARVRATPGLGRFLSETLSVVSVGDRVAEQLPPSARWLDVGCGNGSYLVRLRERYGIEGVGVDFSAPAVEAAATGGIEAVHGTVEDIPYPPNSFDVVSGWWYLEHVPDPQAVIQRVAELVKPGGHVVFGVPNYRSLNARIFRTRWYHLDAPRHLTIWTPATMRRLLEGHGFVVERTAYDRAVWGLRGSLEFVVRGDSDHRRPNEPGRLAKLLLPMTVMSGLARLSDTIVVQARAHAHPQHP